MAWMIQVAVCPRCGHEVRADALRSAAGDWFDSDTPTASSGRADGPTLRPNCASALRVTRPCCSCTTSTCIGCARPASTRRVADAPTTPDAGTDTVCARMHVSAFSPAPQGRACVAHRPRRRAAERRAVAVLRGARGWGACATDR